MSQTTSSRRIAIAERAGVTGKAVQVRKCAFGLTEMEEHDLKNVLHSPYDALLGRTHSVIILIFKQVVSWPESPYSVEYDYSKSHDVNMAPVLQIFPPSLHSSDSATSATSSKGALTVKGECT
ncbi:hypothetical protein V1525DRAFT_213403 [Lipomyces kononenkoae]|uniref:Uncharacterized protein n=1 Tax=Lipomyces kononenkoae TaxID=34357 RepID=A0ACC3SZA9_LIPKO